MKISIIIPMYNVAQYLETCVSSIADQNMNSNDYEIIMVDDGSPDNSLATANQLAGRHQNIKVISQQNKGLGGARNTGIIHASGTYVLFLDADDWLLPNSLTELVKITNDNALDILEFGAILVSENGQTLSTITKNSNGEIYNGIDYYNAIKYSGSACNKLYANTFLQTNKLLFLEKIYGEDFEFNTRAFYKAKKMMAIDTVCAAFLQSPNSITRNKNKKQKNKYLNDFVQILSSISEYKNKSTVDNKNKSVNAFFNERLTMVNINAFYLMFKHNYSYKEMNNYKKRLKDKKLYFIIFPVSIKKKELFRKIMLKHFTLFRLTQPLKSLFKI